jgi:hypothetical protein
MPVLALATIILWIAGLVLLFVARRLKPKGGLEETEPPTWDWILRSIFGGIIAAIAKITKPSGTWELVEGLGDLCFWVGLLTLVGFVFVDVVKLVPGQQSSTASPSPG